MSRPKPESAVLSAAAGGDLARKLEELRRSFDQSFAVRAEASAVELEDFLTVRVGGDGFALRLSEIGGIEADRAIVALPPGRAHLLGLAGIRNLLVPVYSLGSLLGYGPEGKEPRWLALCGQDEPLGLAFSHLERVLRLPLAELAPSQEARQALRPGSGQALRPGSGQAREHVLGLLRADSAFYHLLDIPSIIAAIRGRPSPGGGGTGEAGPPKE